MNVDRDGAAGFQWFEPHAEVFVQESEFIRLLGFPRQHRLEGRALELAGWARQWFAEHGRPWVYARAAGDLQLAPGAVRIRGTEFVSKRLHDQMAAGGAHDAILVAVSAGPECEAEAAAYWGRDYPDKYFFLEIFASAVVEQLIASASGMICAWAESHGLAALPHSSPGYSGWSVADQNRLWDLIRQDEAGGLLDRLSVMETGMLRPKKSQLGVIGLTRLRDRVADRIGLVPCVNCCLRDCAYRRAPFRRGLPHVEDVRRLQGNASEDAPRDGPPGFVLDPNARYSVNARALKKWAKDRLHLDIRPDGSVAASFRYEGTTCSNLGRSIEFDYHVQLGPPAEGYAIERVACGPATGDVGHTFMCEFLKNPEDFMARVRGDQPLVGHPLAAALTWERGSNPAGCHCLPESRSHKWGLVFEVLHFALAQREKEQRKQAQAGLATHDISDQTL